MNSTASRIQNDEFAPVAEWIAHPDRSSDQTLASGYRDSNDLFGTAANDMHSMMTTGYRVKQVLSRFLDMLVDR